MVADSAYAEAVRPEGVQTLSWFGTLRRLLPGVLGLGALSAALLGLGAPGAVGPAGLVVGTAAALGLLLIAVVTARPNRGRNASGIRAELTARMLRCRAGRTGTPRLADPDAPGRSRPRAPSAAHAAV
jgi:hypothetical protein